ncbi:DUF1064 domain-containing protein [Roseivirga sp. BDSF3-8]|uniref:DUF1064 domain-containing protein n=1 Tax=Roseivirga sp. BDSF3-8 TaxID=3241598 RepID=UPI003531F897
MKKKKAKKVQYNGIFFDSTLELKFALLIEDTCEYIYHPLSIWYDRNDLSKFGKQVCPHRYEPDFLVRKLRNHSAHLIEIKNSNMVSAEAVRIKQAVAESYIRRKSYDWSYKVLTDRDIRLSPEQYKKFKEIITTRRFHSNKIRMLRKEAHASNTSYYTQKVPYKTALDLDEAEHYLFVKKGLMKEFS